MKTSVTLLEREGNGAALAHTDSLICSRRPNGAFSLWLTRTSDIGKVRHIVGRQVRTPAEFVDAVLSINGWTDLRLDYETIRDVICVVLDRIDPDFATVLGHLVQSRIVSSGPRAA